MENRVDKQLVEPTPIQPDTQRAAANQHKHPDQYSQHGLFPHLSPRQQSHVPQVMQVSTELIKSLFPQDCFQISAHKISSQRTFHLEDETHQPRRLLQIEFVIIQDNELAAGLQGALCILDNLQPVLLNKSM
jgi:hypothetical protein